jgi:SAM-dependent methyltransferase
MAGHSSTTSSVNDIESIEHSNEPSGSSAAERTDQRLCCPACHGALRVGHDSAGCVECGTCYPLEDGVLCTNRADVFMGEFDAVRMREYTRAARANGWRQTVRDRMLVDNPGAQTVLTSAQRANFVELLGTRSTNSVLDMGAGMGVVSLQLSRHFGTVYALDQTFERMAFLRVVADQEQSGSIVTVCHRDAASLPFRTGALDAVVMIGVFEYLAASYPGVPIRTVQERVLLELHRVLAPGGVLFIATKNRFGWPNWAGATDNSGLRYGALMPRWLADTVSRRLLHRSFRTVTDSYWRYGSLLKQAGFRDLEFFWPVGGYQSPERWANLRDAEAIRDGIRAESRSPAKRAALAALAALRMIKYAVPHFGIVARKAGGSVA